MTSSSFFTKTIVLQALQQAWLDSNPGESGGHEEGGFILRDEDGKLSVERWPRGCTDCIGIPSHEGCKYNGMDIVASFHTHPNIGEDYIQEPSVSDIDGVCDDPHLKGPHYMGEVVISNERLYLIKPNGSVFDVMEMTQLWEKS